VQPYCHYPFYKTKQKKEAEEAGQKDPNPEVKHKYRYSLLKDFLKEWNAPKPATNNANNANTNSIVLSEPTLNQMSLQISAKEFVRRDSIFQASSEVLNRAQVAIYPTDGLIFTPCDLPLPVHPGAHNFKVSWEKSFKWKPPQYNTIDFFVAVRKNKDNQDFVKTTIDSGINMTQIEGVPHKIIELHCGFDKQRHRFVNPFATLMKEFNGTTSGTGYDDENQGYTHQKFLPTCPYMATAYLAYIPLSRNELNEWSMKTEQGEIFNEGTIVEFAYDAVNSYAAHPWRWKPLRVRYDKTANLLAGQKEFGNAYHVADSIWHSIHFPLTQSVIETGQNIQICGGS
jgi:hypothetical protein